MVVVVVSFAAMAAEFIEFADEERIFAPIIQRIENGDAIDRHSDSAAQ